MSAKLLRIDQWCDEVFLDRDRRPLYQQAHYPGPHMESCVVLLDCVLQMALPQEFAVTSSLTIIANQHAGALGFCGEACASDAAERP